MSIQEVQEDSESVWASTNLPNIEVLGRYVMERAEMVGQVQVKLG